MKVTYRWLREMVATELPPRELAERLTMLGLEVESLTRLDAKLGGLRVARVKSVRRHPQADRLTLCEVEDGQGVIPVVCGAPNVIADAFVALAPVGATLPNGTQVRRAKLRGEVSEGMLLSESELGISASHDGILLLEGEPAIGSELVQALGLDDWMLEIGLTPNRSDCLGVLGIAREVAALTGAPLTLPSTDVVESGALAADTIRVDIEAPARCSRYAARIIRAVRIGPSPLWLRMRLAALGMRSISNVVDASNLVLLEWGHPLHVFDHAKVEGGRIVVRTARDGETILTLDGVERTLTTEDLVIADAVRPIAIAGVMGGEHSGVQRDTVDLVLESAHFDPISVRRTARRHGLHTEASHRFERGTDPVGLMCALDRLARVIVDLGGGEVAKGVVESCPRPYQPRRIRFRPARARALLGADVPDELCTKMLTALGVRIAGGGGERGSDALEAVAPSWRPDLEREVDLIEEVARLAGYDQIPARIGTVDGGAGGSAGRPVDPEVRRLEQARDLLAGQGFTEVIRLAFTSPASIARFEYPDGRSEPLRIANPLGDEGSVLATALLPGMLDIATAQVRNGAESVRIFQVARVHRRAGGKWPYREVETAAALLGGPVGSGPFPEVRRNGDFYDLKGTLEILIEDLGIKDIAFRAADTLRYLAPGQAAELVRDRRRLGEIGALAPALTRQLGVEWPLIGFEIDLAEAEPPPARYHSFARHPAALRDLALEVDESVSAEEVMAVLRGGKWVEEVQLFDVYRGDGVPEGRKSLAFHLRLKHPEHTLNESETTAALDRLVETLASQLGAKRR